MYFESPQNPYNYFWHKYRPVILRLMVDAKDAPQEYVFSEHEITRISPKNRNGIEFILHVHSLKALNNIKGSLFANALLKVLRESKTAERLTESSTFEFVLDENFVLHVRKNETIAPHDCVVPDEADSLTGEPVALFVA